MVAVSHTTESPTAGAIIGALADQHRRLVFAAVQLGASTIELVAAATHLTDAQVAKAMGKLVEVGVMVHGEGGLEVAGSVFQVAARAALARPAVTTHDGLPDDVRKVMNAFVADGRLQSIPSSHSKRLVVLDWLAQLFEPGRRYSEAMVNLTLGQRHPDTAALRRYLVDDGFLDRADGHYWRSGGSITAPPEP
jgi:hypothetical protein